MGNLTGNGSGSPALPCWPAELPLLPPIPAGFERWVYRGIKYASPRAIMVTSIDVTMDGDWDPPIMFQTDGDDHTHYAEAVIDHHYVCKCAECLTNAIGEARREGTPPQ